MGEARGEKSLVSEREQRVRVRQERLLGAGCPIPGNAAQLFNDLRNTLLAAWRDGQLLTTYAETFKLLQSRRGTDKKTHGEIAGHLKSDAGDISNTYLIAGGSKDEKRRSEDGRFRRRDDALLNFFVIVEEVRSKPLRLLVYHFNLQLPPTARATNRLNP